MFDKRLTGDYDDFIEFDIETVEAMHRTTTEFIDAVRKLLPEGK